MRATTATDFRKNLAAELDRVESDREPLIIVRTGGKPAAVLMSLEEFGSLTETDYLLRSPANREALLESIKQAEEGKLIEVPWPE
ncbi:MAG TPA: type II toxin-antitoxin system prevent-host-death family antitoxin [Devosia sp.]